MWGFRVGSRLPVPDMTQDAHRYVAETRRMVELSDEAPQLVAVHNYWRGIVRRVKLRFFPDGVVPLSVHLPQYLFVVRGFQGCVHAPEVDVRVNQRWSEGWEDAGSVYWHACIYVNR